MGNEGNGIRINIQKGITHPIMIPKIGVGESLNVATATAILLSEFVRMQ
jgi:TrmH family RNA methyltransferase